jgi:hypothetical protein
MMIPTRVAFRPLQQSKCIWGCAMVQTVSWFLTTEDQFRAWVSDARCVVDKVALEQIFLRVLQFSSEYHSTMALHTHIIWGMNRPVCGHSSETVSPHWHEQEKVNAEIRPSLWRAHTGYGYSVVSYTAPHALWPFYDLLCPHLSSNHSWFIHQSSLANTSRDT